MHTTAPYTSNKPPPAEPVDDVAPVRPTSTALQRSLTRLTASAAVVGLIWLACWVVLAPPEDIDGPWRILGLLALLLAATCWFSVLRPGQRWTRWVPAACTTTMYVSLAWVHIDSGLVGWWRSTELAAVLALGMTLALTTRTALVVEVGILAVAATVLYEGTVNGTVGAGTVAMASAGFRLLAVASVVWIANALLRGGAERADALLLLEAQQRELLAAQERTQRSDNAARRFLHDSGMNSLEAVSRGVPDDAVAALRERCRIDSERWLTATSTIASDTASAFRPVFAEAQMRGIDVHSDFRIHGQIPAQPLEALVLASAEALRNVAKHAGVSTASLVVEIANGQATVQIVDAGRGFTDSVTPRGMGLSESISRQMADIGGHSEVWSRPGQGTRVELHWPVKRPDAELSSEPKASPYALPGVIVKIAWAAVILTAVGAVASTAVNWWSVQSPWLVAATGLALAATAAWFLVRWQRGVTDSFDVGVATAAVAMATLALQVADPFCSAASGAPLIPDGRQLIVVILGVLLASWRASLLLLFTTFAAVGAAAAMQHFLWPLCIGYRLPGTLGLIVVTIASVAMGRALRAQESAARAAFAAAEESSLEVARQRADDLVRQQWATAAVMQAQQLLSAVADPATDLGGSDLRRQASDCARRLRATVRARELPVELATVLTGIVEDGRVHDYPVTVEGSFSDELNSQGVAMAARELRRWWSTGHMRPDDVSVTLSSFAGVSSILVVIDAASEPPSFSGESPVVGREVRPRPDLVGPAVNSEAVTMWRDGPSTYWRVEWRTHPGH